MSKVLPLYIGLRYILAKQDNRFISFTSLISMAGLTLGVLILILVMSIFNGLQGEQRTRTLITVPHGDIYSDDNFEQWQAASELLLAQEEVLGVSPFITTEAMLSQLGYHQVTEIKGIVPSVELEVSSIEDSMIQGSLLNLEEGQKGIVLGSSIASSLRLSGGDPVNILIPQINGNSNNFTIETHRFTVVGIFDVQYSIGSDLVLIHIEDSLELMGLEQIEEAVHLRLKVSDIDNANDIVASSVQLLESSFPGSQYKGEDWSELESSTFSALKREKILTWFMLMMIVAIGAFNIISTLVMVVAEKQADIAILRTMGASKATIMNIFMIQGVVVGISGTLLGACLGITLALKFGAIAAFFESLLFQDNLYMISFLPSDLHMQDVYITCFFALAISFLATIYPAWKASRILPAEVLRYE